MEGSLKGLKGHCTESETPKQPGRETLERHVATKHSPSARDIRMSLWPLRLQHTCAARG